MNGHSSLHGLSSIINHTKKRNILLRILWSFWLSDHFVQCFTRSRVKAFAFFQHQTIFSFLYFTLLYLEQHFNRESFQMFKRNLFFEHSAFVMKDVFPGESPEKNTVLLSYQSVFLTKWVAWIPLSREELAVGFRCSRDRIELRDS